MKRVKPHIDDYANASDYMVALAVWKQSNKPDLGMSNELEITAKVDLDFPYPRYIRKGGLYCMCF